MKELDNSTIRLEKHYANTKYFGIIYEYLAKNGSDETFCFETSQGEVPLDHCDFWNYGIPFITGFYSRNGERNVFIIFGQQYFSCNYAFNYEDIYQYLGMLLYATRVPDYRNKISPILFTDTYFDSWLDTLADNFGIDLIEFFNIKILGSEDAIQIVEELEKTNWNKIVPRFEIELSRHELARNNHLPSKITLNYKAELEADLLIIYDENNNIKENFHESMMEFFTEKVPHSMNRDVRYRNAYLETLDYGRLQIIKISFDFIHPHYQHIKEYALETAKIIERKLLHEDLPFFKLIPS
jgi:hypothetical protein